MPDDPLLSATLTGLLDLLVYLKQANQIALLHDPLEMEDRTLALLMEISQARAGLLYLFDQAAGDLVLAAARQGPLRLKGANRRGPVDRGLVGRAFRERRAIFTERLAGEPGWDPAVDGLPAEEAGSAEPAESASLTNSIPLLLGEKPTGVIQLLGPKPEARSRQACVELVQAIGNRLAADIDRAVEIQAIQQRSARLDELISIFGQIGATLDRDQILRMMLDYARQVTNAEACSLFLTDEAKGDIVLHLSSNNLAGLRVPAGKGIIGQVIATGETLLVLDAQLDERHYTGVDQVAGFVTRDILAVPLRSRQVVLGGERGILEEKVIGGIEALNKLEGIFDAEDARVLVTLANQAATVLEIAGLYSDANQLFFDAIQALAEAIDAKDPYTEGHSQRVSAYSVEIARELGLPADTIHRIRIGSLLHDVGKIGIPDHILTKPGRLTQAEFEVMKSHPGIGEKIMSQVGLLRDELPALAQHHERLNGQGYPQGLKKEKITLAGQVVAVADVFDALTSDRPYREGVPVEDALGYLLEKVDHEFDRRCVRALIRDYSKGRIKTQREAESRPDADE